MAASIGLIFHDKSDNAPNIEGPASVKVGLLNFIHAPKGRDVKTLQGHQPGDHYLEFLNESWRSIARAVGIPLMIARLDASHSNYSSSRLERTLYARSLESYQHQCDFRWSPVLLEVLREAELRKLIPPRPQAIKIAGLYSPLPMHDPSKELQAQETALRIGATSWLDMLQAQGVDVQDATDKLRRSVDALNEIDPALGTVICNHSSAAHHKPQRFNRLPKRLSQHLRQRANEKRNDEYRTRQSNADTIGIDSNGCQRDTARRRYPLRNVHRITCANVVMVRRHR